MQGIPKSCSIKFKIIASFNNVIYINIRNINYVYKSENERQIMAVFRFLCYSLFSFFLFVYTTAATAIVEFQWKIWKNCYNNRNDTKKENAVQIVIQTKFVLFLCDITKKETWKRNISRQNVHKWSSSRIHFMKICWLECYYKAETSWEKLTVRFNNLFKRI